MRKLASIQKISNIEPIEGKDRIVLASIEGWHVIVGKQDFQIGDKCVYIEIDSVLDPRNPVFEQARKRSNRVRTMKLGNIYSEGIAYPLSAFNMNPNDWNEGDDVTELLHIEKYDEYGDKQQISIEKKPKYSKWQLFWYKIFGFPKHTPKNHFPSLVSKTDEERIQNHPQWLQYKESVSVSEKIDGQSCTALLERGKGLFPKEKFTLCSRNYALEKDGSNYWKAAEKYDLENRMSLIMEELNVPWIAIQGEVAGPGIQKNPLKLEDIDLFIFNIILPCGRFGNKEMVELCYRYGLTTVPMISYDYILPDTVDELLEYATGPSMINPNIKREGIVIRTQDGSKSFKAVSPEYLIIHNK